MASAFFLFRRFDTERLVDDLENIFSDADILLSLSTYESFPGSIKDAFAAGVLVVATPVGGVKELVIDNKTGILCRDTSVEALMEGIHRGLKLEPENSQSIRQRARKIARLELHPYRTANDLFRIYNLAIKNLKVGIGTDNNNYPNIPNIETRLISSGSTRSGMRASYISPIAPARSSQPVGAGLTYQLRIEKPNWSGIDIFIGTHLKLANGELMVKLKSQTGNLLREAHVDLVNARDNDWLDIRFAPISHSENQTFYLEFTIEGSRKKTLLSVYQTTPHQARSVYLFRRVIQTIGFKLKSNHLYCRTWYN